MKRWKPARFLFSPRTWTSAVPAGTKFNFNYDDDTNMFENGWTKSGTCTFTAQSNKGFITVPADATNSGAVISLADAEDDYETVSIKVTAPEGVQCPFITFGTDTMSALGAAYGVILVATDRFIVAHLDGATFYPILIDVTTERTVEIIRVSDTTFDVKIDDTTYNNDGSHFTIIAGGALGNFTATDKNLGIVVTTSFAGDRTLYVDDLVAAWAS